MSACIRESAHMNGKSDSLQFHLPKYVHTIQLVAEALESPRQEEALQVWLWIVLEGLFPGFELDPTQTHSYRWEALCVWGVWEGICKRIKSEAARADPRKKREQGEV